MAHGKRVCERMFETVLGIRSVGLRYHPLISIAALFKFAFLLLHTPRNTCVFDAHIYYQNLINIFLIYTYTHTCKCKVAASVFVYSVHVQFPGMEKWRALW